MPLDQLDPALKPDKLPGRGIDTSRLVIDLENPCTEAVLTWWDVKGKQQKGYNACRAQRGQRTKWLSTRFWAKRYEQVLARLRHQIRTSTPGGRAWEAAVIALIIADTGMRPGTRKSKSNARYGATTLERRHVSFQRNGVHLHFVGKAKKHNCHLLTEPLAMAAIRAAYSRTTDPKGELFLLANENDVNRALSPSAKGLTAKDLRTIRGSTLAARALEHTPSPLPGASCRDVQRTFSAATKPVRVCLNNQPAQARAKYIDPSVYMEWSRRNGWTDTPCRDTMPNAPNGQPWHIPGVWNDDAWMPRQSRLFSWWQGKTR